MSTLKVLKFYSRILLKLKKATQLKLKLKKKIQNKLKKSMLNKKTSFRKVSSRCKKIMARKFRISSKIYQNCRMSTNKKLKTLYQATKKSYKISKKKCELYKIFQSRQRNHITRRLIHSILKSNLFRKVCSNLRKVTRVRPLPLQKRWMLKSKVQIKLRRNSMLKYLLLRVV